MINFIAVSAPSGAGKTTICRALQKRLPGVQFSLSCTTRPKRSIETDGVDYTFITDQEFTRMVAAAEFAEYENVHGYYYGTPKKILRDTLAAKQQMLFEVDVKGAMSIKQLYPENSLTVFIIPPDIETLVRRLKKRGTETEASINKRLERFAVEIDYQDRFDHKIINDDVDRATEELINIIS